MFAERALFVTLSNIGDAVMTTPVLQLMHEVLPNTRIDIVADARSSLIFQHCPYRGDILLRDKQAGSRGLAGLIHRLRQRRYRLVVDLRTDGLPYLLKADHRLLKRRSAAAHGHAVMRHLAAVAGLRELPVTPATQVWLAPAEYAWADDVLSRLPPGRWLALGPGANWPPKIWPLANFAKLLELAAPWFAGAIICGGPADHALATSLTRQSPIPTLNLAGSTNLLQAAAVLRRAACFVGNDSGLGHIAAAMATPTIAVFGPGDPDRYHPWGPHADWLVAADQDLARLAPQLVADRLIPMLSTR